MAQQYIINNFYGGMAGDDYLGGEGSFLYSENIDVRKNYNGTSLIKALDNQGTTAEKVLGFIELFKGNQIPRTIGYAEGGKVYSPTGAEILSINTGDDIVNAFKYSIGTDNYIYFVTYSDLNGVQLHRINSDDAFDNANTVYGFNQYTYNNIAPTIPIESSYGSKVPILNYQDLNLYIGVGREIYKSEDGISFVSVFANKLESDIIGLTQYAGLFKIYLNSGKIYFWDGVSDAFNAITDINNNIQYVYAASELDYIIAGPNSEQSELHVLQGYQTQLLQNVIYSERENKIIYPFGHTLPQPAPQIMCKKGGLLYIGTNSTLNSGLYTYGSNTLGVLKSFQNSYIKDDSNNIFTTINAVNSYKDGIYVSYSNGGVNLIGRVFQNIVGSNTIQSEGLLITRVFDGGIRNQIKQVKSINIKTVYTDTSNYLTIYIKRDGANWEQLGVCDEMGKNKYEIIDPIGEFHDVQFKIKFDGDKATRLKLEEISFEYELIK